MAAQGLAGFGDDAFVRRGDEEAELAVEADDFELEWRGEAVAAGGTEDPLRFFKGIRRRWAERVEGRADGNVGEINGPTAAELVEFLAQFRRGSRGVGGLRPEAAAGAIRAEAERAQQEPKFEGVFDLSHIHRGQRAEAGGNLQGKRSAGIERGLRAALTGGWLVGQGRVFGRVTRDFKDAEDQTRGGGAAANTSEKLFLLPPDGFPAAVVAADVGRRAVEGTIPPANHAADRWSANLRRVLVGATAKGGGEKFDLTLPMHI